MLRIKWDEIPFFLTDDKFPKGTHMASLHRV